MAKTEQAPVKPAPATADTPGPKPGISPAYPQFDLDNPVLPEVIKEKALASGGFAYDNKIKGKVYDEDLLALMHESFHDAPEAYQIHLLKVTCGSIPADATVQMAGPWVGDRSATGSGDGPIAAAFAAISEILGRPVEVTNLSLRSVTPGRDSVGQVFLQCRIGGKSLSGQGASTDIVEASARALVHALNKERHAEHLEAEAHDAVQLWGV